MPAKSPTLGAGIYRMADVARYTRIHHSTVRSWFLTRNLLHAEYVRVNGEMSVSFHDLIDAMVASCFRSHGVTMKVVRRAYKKLESTLQTRHPFCHQGLYTDGKAIIVDVAKTIRETVLQDAISNQHLFDNIKCHLHDVSYSSRTKLAERWNISPGVVIDPAIAVGLPVVDGTGVTTYVVRNAYHANGQDRAFVAHLYGLTAKQVDNAVRFEDGLKAAA